MDLKFEKFREYAPGEKEGESLERELLGVVKNVKDIKEERHRIQEIMRDKNISEFEAAIEDVKERQFENPINPKQIFINFVRKDVFDELPNEFKDYDKLKFYTTVSDSKNKTVLDRDFGIDGFFELEKDTISIIVTFDITFRPLKENPKADIIFSLPQDFPIQARFEKEQLAGLSKSEYKIFQKYTEDLAQKIAQKIKIKLENK